MDVKMKFDLLVSELELLKTVPGHREAALRAEYNHSCEMWQGVCVVELGLGVQQFEADKAKFLARLQFWLDSYFPIHSSLWQARLAIWNFSLVPIGTTEAVKSEMASFGNVHVETRG